MYHMKFYISLFFPSSSNQIIQFSQHPEKLFSIPIFMFAPPNLKSWYRCHDS